ncbi:hypothetical protein LP419_24425 [Massilia sp. H-1]|nr:hypothetical protein LP419_24425 [Massilia sp. H-1]
MLKPGQRHAHLWHAGHGQLRQPRRRAAVRRARICGISLRQSAGAGLSQRDWLLNLAGLQAGDRFTLSATVPEPATFTLMLACLFLLGRRQR